MPKKKSIWMRETPCLACEQTMLNYQFMAKSQTVSYDEWMVAYTEPLSNYEPFPTELKTTVCPSCLLASNEYSFGVDDYKMFARSPARHQKVQEYYNTTIDDRFNVLANSYEQFEEDSAALDQKKNLPPYTRSRATFEKIWSQREQYGIPFMTKMLAEPRDHVTCLVALSLDRYCQLIRISFDQDVEPDTWDNHKLKKTIEDHFTENTLEMKMASPRFYFIATNYLQSARFIEQLIEELGDDCKARHQGLVDSYWEEAFKYMKLSHRNDDLSAIPCELVDGGVNWVLSKLHFRFNEEEEGKKCLRAAKSYADRLKRISSKTQQTFVNAVDDMMNTYFAEPAEGEGEEEAAEA